MIGFGWRIRMRITSKWQDARPPWPLKLRVLIWKEDQPAIFPTDPKARLKHHIGYHRRFLSVSQDPRLQAKWTGCIATITLTCLQTIESLTNTKHQLPEQQIQMKHQTLHAWIWMTHLDAHKFQMTGCATSMTIKVSIFDMGRRINLPFFPLTLSHTLRITLDIIDDS